MGAGTISHARSLYNNVASEADTPHTEQRVPYSFISRLNTVNNIPPFL